MADGEDYIEIEFTTDSQTLADDAVDRLKAKWPGWEPNDGDLEVVQIEAIAPMAADVNETLSRVSRSIFRDFGTNMKGLPYQVGTRATSTITVTAIDSDGYSIPAGSQFSVDGFAFQTTQDVFVEPGATSLSGIVIEAVEIGSAFSGLTGTNVTPLSALAFITDVVLDDPTAGGVDEETQESYQSRLSRRLMLSAETLVTRRDYELIALDDPEVFRVVAFNDGERNVLVVAINSDGDPISSEAKTRINAVYQDYRLVNTTVQMDDPDYSDVSVIWEVKAYPGYAIDDVRSRVNDALTQYLSPAQWGVPRLQGDSSLGGARWYNDTTVRKNKLIDIIGDVEGVDYVIDLIISGESGTDSLSNGDLLMPGAVALPNVIALTGTVNSSAPATEEPGGLPEEPPVVSATTVDFGATFAREPGLGTVASGSVSLDLGSVRNVRDGWVFGIQLEGADKSSSLRLEPAASGYRVIARSYDGANTHAIVAKAVGVGETVSGNPTVDWDGGGSYDIAAVWERVQNVNPAQPVGSWSKTITSSAADLDPTYPAATSVNKGRALLFSFNDIGVSLDPASGYTERYDTGVDSPAWQTTNVLDSGVGADQSPLAGNWAHASSLGEPNQFKRLADHIRPQGAVGNSSYWTTEYDEDQELFLTLDALGELGASDYFDLFIRGTGYTGTPTCYWIHVDGTAVTTEYDIKFYKIVAGVSTQLGATISAVVINSGDQIGVSAVGSDLTFYVNQTEIGTRSDGAVTGNGRLAIGAAGADWSITSFGGGSYVPGSPTTVPAIQLMDKALSASGAFATVTGATYNSDLVRKMGWYTVIVQPTDSNLVPLADGSGSPDPLSLQLGVAVTSAKLSNATYSTTVDTNFDSVVAEFEMSPSVIAPVAADTYVWTGADAVCQWAEDHGKYVYGHALITHKTVPPWVTALTDAGAAETALRNYVSDVVSHFATDFPGVVRMWDAVHEPFQDTSDSMRVLNDQGGAYKWATLIGTGVDGYIDVVCEEIRAADPDCLIFLNDHSMETNSTKRAGMLALATRLHAAGKCDGVGFENHFDSSNAPTAAQYRDTVYKPFIDAGLLVAVTELDAAMNIGGTITTVAQQEAIYEAVSQGAKLGGAVQLTAWALRDQDSWRGDNAKAAPFNNDFTRKAQYISMASAVGRDVGLPDPTPSGFQVGVVFRQWKPNDSAAWPYIKNGQNAPNAVRFGLNFSDGATVWSDLYDFYRGLGIRNPQPCFHFAVPPNNATTDAIAAWALTRAGSGLKYVEWGNEGYGEWTGSGGSGSAEYISRARNTALTAKRLAQALSGSGVGVIVTGAPDDRFTTWQTYMHDGSGVPDLYNYVAGYSCHCYGPEYLSEVYNVINSLPSAGQDSAIFITEFGFSTDDGRTLDSNYGWSRSMTYAQAASSLETVVANVKAVPNVKQFMWFVSTDHRPHGVSTDREHYFGLVLVDDNQMATGLKPSIGPKMKELIAANP